MNQEKIGKFIASCRKEKNITQQELAEKLGVSDRTIGNWENGRNMPDLSLFKPLCKELDITLNDLMSGEKVDQKEYQEKLEENIINTIAYTNKKINKRNYLIGVIFIAFGVFLAITAVSIFPSESSWGSIYSVFGALLSLLGVNQFTKHFTYLKRILCLFGYFMVFLLVLMTIDYIGVVNLHQAPRFSWVKVTGENIIYYDTPFYDVVRCHVNQPNETFQVIPNQEYDNNQYDSYCK